MWSLEGEPKRLKGAEPVPRPRVLEARLETMPCDLQLDRLIGNQRKRDREPAAETVVLPGVWANDARQGQWESPTKRAKGKLGAKSLMQPQELAMRMLPEAKCAQLEQFMEGAPAECGEAWPEDVIEQAVAAGPHTSACTPDGARLMWEDIQCQVDAGFVKMSSMDEILARPDARELKVSRAAVVPQQNRRDRITLNLSAEATMPGSRRKAAHVHPSVNETSVPAADQEAVQRLGQALPAVLRHSYHSDCSWEILWQKIDLSDGFWRMIVERGKELNFVFEMPPKEGDDRRYFVVPSSLQMGWTNSPAHFCTVTEAGRHLLQRLLAFSLEGGLDTPHPFEEYAMPEGGGIKGTSRWRARGGLDL